MPGLQIDGFTWIPVEQSPTYTRLISFTWNHPRKYFTKPVTLMTYGPSSVVLRPKGPDSFQIVVNTLEHRSRGHPPPRE